jgi:hypothetical protein
MYLLVLRSGFLLELLTNTLAASIRHVEYFDLVGEFGFERFLVLFEDGVSEDEKGPYLYTFLGRGPLSTWIIRHCLRVLDARSKAGNAPVADGHDDVILGNRLAELDLGAVAWAGLT